MKKAIISIILFLITSASLASVNLTVTGTIIPTSMYAGSSYTFSVTIKNTGTTSTSANFYVSLYISGQSTYSTATATRIDDIIVYGLAANTSKTVTTTKQISCAYSTGVKYILVGVDATNVVSESTKGDNDFSYSTLIKESSDLVPQGYSLSKSSVAISGTVKATFAVANNGKTDANNFKVGFYLSQSSTLIVSQATYLDYYSVSSVSGCSSSISYSKTLTIPASICNGSYYIHMWIDNEQVVTEAETGANANNFQNIGITITGATSPDIPISSNASNFTQSGFQANWSSANGATGYNLDVSTSNTFESSTFIAGYNNFDVNSNLNATITGLTCNKTYYYRVKAYNACGYKSGYSEVKTVTTASCVTCTTPLDQAKDIIFSNIKEDQITISFTKGSGSKRIVKINTSNSFNDPSTGSDPTASTSYTSSGEQVVYNGTDQSVTVANLSANTTYWFRVYEANCSGSTIIYKTSTETGNPNSQTTSKCEQPIISTQPQIGLVCQGQTASVKVDATGTNLQYQWEKLGSNNSYSVVSNEVNNYFNTTIAGTYRCKVANTCGSLYSNDVIIQFSNCPGPVAKFSAVKTNLIAGESTQFIDNSTNNPTEYLWTIEQQQATGVTSVYLTSTQTNPSIAFKKPGCYKVTLKVSRGSENNSTFQNCYIYVKPSTKVATPEKTARAKKYPSGHAGDPVNVASGAFTFSMKDISVFSSLGESALIRSYNSFNTDSHWFGFGWSFTFGMWIDVSNPYQWELHHGDGHVTSHIPYSDGETRSFYPGLHDSLYYTQTGGFITYTYVERSGVKWNLNSDGLLDNIVDLNGNKTQCYYSSQKLSSINTPGGKYINFAYNAANNIIRASDSSGRIVDYFYDITNNFLDSIRIKSLSNVFAVTKFKYDTNGITEIYDARGNRVIKNVYDGVTHKVLKQYDVYDSVTTFLYDTVVRKTTVLNPRLIAKIYRYDSSYRLLEVTNELNNTRRFNYTNENLVDTAIDENGNKSILVYDDKLNVSKIIDSKEYSDSIGYSLFNKPTYIKNAEGAIYTIKYDTLGNLISATVPEHGTIQKKYDSNGFDTLIVDARNNQIKKVFNNNFDLVGIGTFQGNTKISYDNIGRPVSITNGKGFTDSLYYNYYNQITKIIYPTGDSVLFEYDKNGNQTAFVDKENNKISYEYDLKDRLTKIIEPYNHSTRFEYDALDRITKRADANNNVLRYTYDSANHLKSVIDSIIGTLVSYEYDSRSNKVAVIDGRNKKWQIHYDEHNLPVSYINPLNDSVTVTYTKNRRIESVTNQLGKATRYVYDSAGYIIKTIDPELNFVRTYYDLNGNVDSLKDARGNISKRTYDASNKIKTFNDGFGDYQFEWDSTGNLIKYIDLQNSTHVYHYNPNNELTSVDNNGTQEKRFELSKNGWIANAATANGTIIYLRNPLGWITKRVGYFKDTTSYKYDSVGNVISLTCKDGKQVQYKYNSLNYSNSIIDWNNQTYSIYRDKNNAIDSIVYPNGFRTKVSRDDASQVIKWNNYSRNADSSIFNSNIITREKTGWVLGDTGIKALTPLLFSKTSAATYDKDDRVIASGNITYQNSNNGDVTGTSSLNTNNKYRYNADGTLSSFQHFGQQDSMVYDPWKLRIQKVAPAQTTNYSIDNVLSGIPLSLMEMNIAGQVITHNLYSPEGLLLGRDSLNKFQYLHHDVYGNTVALSDTSKAVTDTYAYGLFGDFSNHKGVSTQPFTFLGMYGIQKEASDLYYIWNRYYDAGTGRFLSKDPYPTDVLSTQGLNRYVYGNNNPSSFVDINGLYPISTVSYDELNWFDKFAISKTGDKIYDILGKVLNVYHIGADLLALIPGFGTEAGLYNALLYGIEGDNTNVAFSLLSAIPLEGDEIVGIKYLNKVKSGLKDEKIILNPPITGLGHTIEKHTINDIEKWARKSKFFEVSEVPELLKRATQAPMKEMRNGYFERVVDAGKNIGIDRTSGVPTSIYTIITDSLGNVITAYPGIRN